MPKTVYIATDPDGGEHTRTTDRTYSHAVLVLSLPWEQDRDFLDREIARVSQWDVEKSPHKTEILDKLETASAACTGTPRWGVAGFNGRHDLAVKQAAKYSGRRTISRVVIVEAHPRVK